MQHRLDRPHRPAQSATASGPQNGDPPTIASSSIWRTRCDERLVRRGTKCCDWRWRATASQSWSAGPGNPPLAIISDRRRMSFSNDSAACASSTISSGGGGPTSAMTMVCPRSSRAYPDAGAAAITSKLPAQYPSTVASVAGEPVLSAVEARQHAVTETHETQETQRFLDATLISSGACGRASENIGRAAEGPGQGPPERWRYG